MAKEATFNFIPEHQIGSKGGVEYRVSINKAGLLYFSREVIEIYDLKGKFFKVYVDQAKNAIAWSVVDRGALSDFHKAKKLTILKIGSGVISIQKSLTALGIKRGVKAYKNLLVKTYKGSYLEEDVQYVTLNDKEPAC